jgi:hypothetical protein
MPTPAIASLPPASTKQFEEMHEALSYRPPMGRNWTPLLLAAAAATIGGAIWAMVTVLA